MLHNLRLDLGPTACRHQRSIKQYALCDCHQKRVLATVITPFLAAHSVLRVFLESDFEVLPRLDLECFHIANHFLG